MTTASTQGLGELAPRYGFIMNPYPSERFSKCLGCNSKTGQRKVSLFIHVQPMHPVIISYTCRYCKKCDLLIAHKHEIEHKLMELFRSKNQGAIGNDYLIVGTVKSNVYKSGVYGPDDVMSMRSEMHDFKNVYSEMRLTKPGYYAPGQKPPMWEPPPSKEWVK